MSFRTAHNWAAAGLMALGMAGMTGTLCFPPLAHGQTELSRKVKTKIAPVYPELARRLQVRGTVRVLVVVSPNGTVKESKVVGGNPVLATAAMEALKKWKFEAASEESTGTVEFEFQPQ